MADESSPNRIGLYERLRGSRVANAGKRLVVRPVKRAVKWVLTRGRVAVEDLGGGATFTHPLGDRYWKNHEGRIRDYEPEIWAIVDRFVGKETVFIDCGANMGLWSCAAAAKIGNPDQVVAVEPNDELLPWLERNRRNNGGRFTIGHLYKLDFYGS